ncbi:DUF2971 domain-containing protein [Pseudoduganella rhizocola]|uniref:DUF2971 domain-containing protein n=1 Tax=Pseudoduganella rhizocola TaxID=3382643 RepID=UPI0038B4ADD0
MNIPNDVDQGIELAPKRLYKYRGFSARTIELLLSDAVFYADPTSFNDPLDTKPCVQSDSTIHELREILRRMVQQRVKEEMEGAARTIKYRGPKTLEHIEKHSVRRAQQLLDQAEYYASDPGYGAPADDAHREILTRHIRTELMGQYGSGVFSLARRFSCPLMWSHYGDEHRGLCVGYSIPERARSQLYRVDYGGSRLIATSRIAAMLDGDVAARSEINAAVFLRKAKDWKYEKEWRHLGPRGLAESPFELTDITFGIRCPDTVKHAVICSLAEREVKISFYEMHEVPNDFSLKRQSVNLEELAHTYPNRALSSWDTENAFDCIGGNPA